MSQIQYCRFINILLKEFKKEYKITKCLKSELLRKIGMLNDMVVHHTNVFQLRGFYWLAASERWAALKTLIQNYYGKYNGDYQASRVILFDENALIESIKELGARGTDTEVVLLERLVTYLQLKQL